MTTSTESLFVLTVAMVPGGARADLLGLASVLHRRGVDVVEAELSRPAHERRVFSATFRSTTRQAETVLRSMQGLVDVLDATLFQAFDNRSATPHPRISVATTGR
jgi:transcription termination factor Rho